MKFKKLIKYYKQKIKTIEKDIDIFSLIPYEDDIISNPTIEQLTICKATLQALKNLQKYKKGQIGCENCKYAKVNITEMPCKKCKRCWKDQWEWGGKDE